jgi:hypothetical protein
MKRIASVLLAGCLLCAVTSVATAEEEPAPSSGAAGKAAPAAKAKKASGRKAKAADPLQPIRRVRDALAELGFKFRQDEDDENALSLVFEGGSLFRGDVRFRLAYRPHIDLLQAQGILAEEDLVPENISRARVFASEKEMSTYIPKIIVDTNIAGGAIVTEWNWQPLGGMSDEALETNISLFVTATLSVVTQAIEENIYPSSLAVSGDGEDDTLDGLESPFP